MIKRLYVALAMTVCIIAPSGNAFVIDDFITGPQSLRDPPKLTVPTIPNTGVADSGGITTWRATRVTRDSGVANVPANISGGTAAYDTLGANTTGHMTMWWDGDNDTVLDFDNTTFDFTQGSANFIHSTLGTGGNVPATVTFRAYYGGAGAYGEATRTVPNSTENLEFWIPYSEFGLGVDFANLNAFSATLTSSMPGNQHTYLTGDVGLEGTSQLPEPGTFALMGVLLGIGGLMFRRMSSSTAAVPVDIQSA